MHMGWFVVVLVVKKESVFVLLYPFIPPQWVTPSKNATTFFKSHHHTNIYTTYIHTYIIHTSHAASISTDIYDPNHTSTELPPFISHPYCTRHLVLFIIMYSATMIKGFCFLNIPSHPVLSTSKELFLVLYTHHLSLAICSPSDLPTDLPAYLYGVPAICPPPSRIDLAVQAYTLCWSLSNELYVLFIQTDGRYTQQEAHIHCGPLLLF